ncbi:hypothetical protein LDENG_00024550 [Lucifuga dentata]|nr:hypothetical protein LDENG_00024550 [Lucifuga dentata]
MHAVTVWRDPELAWNTSVYPYDQVVLPASKIWTPELQVTNGILTTMKQGSQDLLVYSNGTIIHHVIINAEVDCEVDLFNYPFSADQCPVAIQAWAFDGCGMELVMGVLIMTDDTHGDWNTDDAELQHQRYDRNYIMVFLSNRFINPFITLLLPSILIIVADVVSFSLPLGGGERNCFKVTLVLSFTMFLVILNDLLPGGSYCSPIIRTHFCICLTLLVLSMLVSMLLTRVAKDGSFIFCYRFKRYSENTDKEKKGHEESKDDISTIQLDPAKEESLMLRKVVHFLEALDAKELDSNRYQEFADKLDKIVFWVYCVIIVSYFTSMFAVMVNYSCKVNHFDFWY